MNTSRSVESKIIRQLLRRQPQRPNRTKAEGFIATVALVACLGLFTAFVPGLLWVLLLTALVLTLGG